MTADDIDAIIKVVAEEQASLVRHYQDHPDTLYAMRDARTEAVEHLGQRIVDRLAQMRP